MAKTAATEDALGTLHAGVANALADIIREGVPVVVKDAEGEASVVKVPASAAYFAAAITFLKNNNITSDGDDQELGALKQALAKRAAAKPAAITAAALDEAAELFGSRLQ